MRLESKIDHLSCITSSSSKLEYSKRGDRTLSEIFLGWMLCFSQYSFALFSIFTWFLKRHIVIWSFINKPVSSIEGIISLSTKLFAISSPFSIVEDFMSNFLSIVTVKIYQLTIIYTHCVYIHYIIFIYPIENQQQTRFQPFAVRFYYLKRICIHSIFR